MIDYVKQHAKFGGGINSHFIALIPKDVNSSSFTTFHPISLFSVPYKIISKIIVAILKLLLSKLISKKIGLSCWETENNI